MTSSTNLRPFAALNLALKRGLGEFPSLLFYALLMAGATVVLYFPVLDYYGRAFEYFYGDVGGFEQDTEAAIEMVREMTFMLPAFLIYLFASATFLMSWVTRHGVETESEVGRIEPMRLLIKGGKAGLKLIGGLGWLGVVVLPAIFLIALIIRLLTGSGDELPPAFVIWALQIFGVFLGLLIFLPVGLSLAAIGRGEKLSAFTAFGRLRGARISGVVAMAILFLIPAVLRLELGIWFVDQGWLGPNSNTGTLGFLFISTFTESVILLIWMGFSERLLLASRTEGAGLRGEQDEPPTPAEGSPS